MDVSNSNSGSISRMRGIADRESKSFTKSRAIFQVFSLSQAHAVLCLNKISKNLNGKTTKQYKKELVHQILVTKKIDNTKAI